MSEVQADKKCIRASLNLKNFSHRIPQGNEYEFASLFESFSDPMERISHKTVSIMLKLCTRKAEKMSSAYERADFLGFASSLVEEIEDLLKQIDSCMDSMNDSRERDVMMHEKIIETQFSENSSIQRPVLDPPPNNDITVFHPFYRDINHIPVIGKPGIHPYQEYILSWSIAPSHLDDCIEYPFQDMAKTPLFFVSSLEDLQKTIVELQNEDIIAVDLEHHQYHSYSGLTCLMQLSSHSADYIIDAIAVRKHMHLMKDLFLSSSIVKIFHGALEDIKWLQRDFGLYVCNMFDTGIALQHLRQPRGLAHLLQSHCGITVDKSYQLADWRLRPLTDAMIDYARGDTHYLPYCYLKLRNLLKLADEESGTNLLRKVWEESRQMCLTLYNVPEITEEQCDETFFRHYGDMDAQQIAVVRALFFWRDKKCRELDESYHALMKNSIITKIARQRPLSATDFAMYVGKRKTSLTPFIHEILDIVQRIVDTVSKEAIVTTYHSKRHDCRARKQSVAQTHVEMTGTLPSIEVNADEENEVKLINIGQRVLDYDESSSWNNSMYDLFRE